MTVRASAATGAAVVREAPEVGRTLRLVELLRANRLDVLLVGEPVNLRYLTGFTGTNGLALVPAADESRPRFLTDFRYATQSAAQLPELYEREIVTVDLLRAAAAILAPENAEEDTVAASPKSAAAGTSRSAGTAGQGAPGAGPRKPWPASGSVRLGFDDAAVTVKQHARLQELLGERFELVPSAGVVEGLRERKDAAEVARIAAAAELADEALRQVLEAGIVGRTEREVAIELESRMRRLGATAPSFPSIVAAGEHSALPHAEARELPIPPDTLVTIDWGALHDGYCSDCTRTYATGEHLPEHAREVYQLVLRAQQAGVAAVRPGPEGREVDAVAREIIDQAGHGEHFGHGLGHGVGLEVHEAPRLSRIDSEQPLRAGHVVTVEPGVYIPGAFGVRIEDLLFVTHDGHRVLSGLPRELTTVD
jgi:Xaa-Pro aminopeptidase